MLVVEFKGHILWYKSATINVTDDDTPQKSDESFVESCNVFQTNIQGRKSKGKSFSQIGIIDINRNLWVAMQVTVDCPVIAMIFCQISSAILTNVVRSAK